MDIFEYINLKNINKHYWNRYVRFITDIHNKGNRNLKYKEKHHIIPKCINESLYNDINNKIVLTPREHYIAHKILSYCYVKGTNEYNRLVFALFAMSKLKMKYHNRDNLISSREYEILRTRYSDARRCYMKMHIEDKNYEKLKGKNQPSFNKGMICITNGVTNRYINSTDKIPKGWHRGSTQKPKCNTWHESLKNSWSENKQNRIGENHPMYGKGYLLKGKSGTTKNKKCVNKDGINKFVFEYEVDYYIQLGYNKGRCRTNGRVIKNNSLYVFKNDTVKLIYKDEKDKYLNLGWKLGNPHSSNKGSKNGSFGKICVNNNVTNKRVKPEQVNDYLEKGWKLGMIRIKNS